MKYKRVFTDHNGAEIYINDSYICSTENGVDWMFVSREDYGISFMRSAVGISELSTYDEVALKFFEEAEIDYVTKPIIGEVWRIRVADGPSEVAVVDSDNGSMYSPSRNMVVSEYKLLERLFDVEGNPT